MLGVRLDTADLRYLMNEVDRLNRFGIPNAARDTLNQAAFEVRDQARGGLKNEFTLRNTYTNRSIMADRTSSRHIEDMVTVVGSAQDYMRKQEEGFSESARGSHGLAIPTPGAAGEKGGIRRRTRPISRRNYLTTLQPVKAYGWNIMGPSNRGRSGIMAAIYFAIASGGRTIFIDRRRDHYHRKTGVYLITGGTKAKPEEAKMTLIYAVTKRNAKTPPHKWLMPKAEPVAAKLSESYRKNLIKWIEKGKRK
jgi:hypothetical protein